MNTPLLFTHADRRRLGSLLESSEAHAVTPWRRLDKLLWELEESAATEPRAIPDDVVTMNSTVLLVHQVTGEPLVCTVVYPDDVELFDDAISVLAPLGSRLIGCEVGDTVDCDAPRSCGPWRIVEISYQPERAGEYHL